MAFFGVGYISAIGHAMNLAGLYISKQDGDGEVRINLWFAGGFLSCLFWVSIIHVQGKILCLSTTCLSRAYCPHTQLSCMCLPVCLSVCLSAWHWLAICYPICFSICPFCTYNCCIVAKSVLSCMPTTIMYTYRRWYKQFGSGIPLHLSGM